MRTIKESSLVKASKPHQCNFCGYKIYLNDTYVKSTHVYDNAVYDWKAHKHCDEIATRLKMYEDLDDEGLTQEMFQENINETYNYLIIQQLPQDFRTTNPTGYNIITHQLSCVRFFDKLGYVIRTTK
jgi:hypothetical protein